MTTRKKPVQKDKTLLSKLKSVFKEELDKRIALGEEITKDRIDNDTAFATAKKEFSEWSDYNLELIKQSFTEPYNECWKSYDNAGTTIGLISAVKGGRQEPWRVLSQFIKRVESKVDYLNKLKNKVDILESSAEVTKVLSEANVERNMSQVFIVHGHDEEAKTKTARFVEKLGLDAIILHEQASSSRSIIEKIEEYSDVGFGSVLYTSCDIGGKQTEKQELNSRARQNVVFEHGFLIGKIKRENVCALVKGDVELPNDISGVIYISMDDADAWKYTIAKEMKASG